MALPRGGKDILVKFKNDAGSPAFVTLAGLRTKEISMNAELVDITNSDSVNQCREILDGIGVRSLSVSGAGVAKDVASLEVIRDSWAEQELRDTEFFIPDFGTFACKTKVTTFVMNGEYNGAVMFNASLESSGDITFTSV